MLTNQHRFVARMIDCRERTDYKKHMCGVCHALGDDYGYVSRLITNHEIILLNMLTEAQCETPTADVIRRCPLNPRLNVKTNQTVSSRFAAAIAVMLVNTSVEDDLRDGKGLQLPTRLLKAMTSRLATRAQDTLSALAFDTAKLLSLQDEQSHAEKHGSNPLLPSMESSATIFAMTGNLAGQPHNQPALATVGANYGAYLYLLDALKDYSEDYHSGQYNPLLPYARATDSALILGQDGIEWLKAQFNDILEQIRAGVKSLKLFQYQSALETMLIEPIQRILTRLDSLTDGIHYAQITRGDVWKSLLLMSEKKPDGQDVDEFFSDEDDSADHPTKKKRRRRKKDNNSDDGDESCCSDGDWAHSCSYTPFDFIFCYDMDCDGTPNCMDTDAGCAGVDGCDMGGCGGDGCDVGGCDGMDCGGADCG